MGIKADRKTINKVFEEAGYRRIPPRYKPYLSKEQKSKRLRMALFYKQRERTDPAFWHGVIFTDEMSIEVGLRRGKDLVTRLPNEEWHKDCILRRYKNYSTIMFWGAIGYNWKGPCHIWEKESAKEKKKNDAEVQKMKDKYEPIARAEFEQWLKKRGKKPGRQPTFKFTAFSRNGKAGGIDWFR